MIEKCLIEFADPMAVMEWCELNIPDLHAFGVLEYFRVGEMGKITIPTNWEGIAERFTLQSSGNDGVYRIFFALVNAKTVIIDDSDAELLFTLRWL